MRREAINDEISDKQSVNSRLNTGHKPIHPNPYMVTVGDISWLNDTGETINVNASTNGKVKEGETIKFIERLRKRGIAHRDISYAIGLYGPKYSQYKELCKRYGVPIGDEDIVVETSKDVEQTY